MQVVITCLASSPVYLGDIYTSVNPGTPITIDRTGPQLAEMASLAAAVAAGTISVSATPTAAELSSGLLTPPQAVQAQDVAPVADAAKEASTFTIRHVFVAGGAAAVPVFAVNALPFKFRVLDAALYVSTAVGASTVDIQREAAADAVGMQFDSATTGKKEATAATASALFTPGATKGLFLLRSAAGVAGEVVLTCRRES